MKSDRKIVFRKYARKFRFIDAMQARQNKLLRQFIVQFIQRLPIKSKISKMKNMRERPKKLDTNISGRTEGGLVGTRYGLPQMSQLMDEKRSLPIYMLIIEGDVPHVISKHCPHIVPPQYAKQIRTATYELTDRIDETLRAVDAQEAVTHHREDAIFDVLRDAAGSEARNYVHIFMTSADSSETAKNMWIRDGIKLLIPTVEGLRDTCLEVAKDWAQYVHMVSTHGADALPEYLGKRLAFEAYQLDDSVRRLFSDLKEHVVGKLSGATGNYHAMTAEGIDGIAIERECCDMWKLRQVVALQDPAREHIAYVMSDIATLGRTVASIMRWIKYLKNTARTELREPPDEGQKGSSAMPHKTGNPFIEERDIGFSYLLKGTAGEMLDTINREDARTLEGSAIDRIRIPEAFILIDNACGLAQNVLLRCEPQPEGLAAGVNRTYGATTSERVRYTLVRKGMEEREARKLTGSLARKAMLEKTSFAVVLLFDEKIRQYLTEREIGEFADPANYLGESGKIIERAHEELFGRRVSLP